MAVLRKQTLFLFFLNLQPLLPRAQQPTRVKGREDYFCSLSPKTSKLLEKDSDFYRS